MTQLNVNGVKAVTLTDDRICAKKCTKKELTAAMEGWRAKEMVIEPIAYSCTNRMENRMVTASATGMYTISTNKSQKKKNRL